MVMSKREVLAALPGPFVGQGAARRWIVGGTVRAALARIGDGRLATWRVHAHLDGGSDTVVVLVGPDDGALGLLKVGASARGSLQLQRQAAVLAALHGEDRLGPWREMLPRLLGEIVVDGRYCLVETRVPGQDARVALADPARRTGLTAMALATVGQLHRRTATPVRINDAVLAHLLGGPIGTVRAAVSQRTGQVLDRLGRELGAGLHGRVVATGWVHGDYCPDNILIGADGSVSGIVDWAQGDHRGLPILDLVSFLLSSEVTVGEGELGAVVCRWRGTRQASTKLLLEAHEALGGDPLDIDVLVLLAWLQHVANNLFKSRRYASNPVWLHRNVHSVLKEVIRD
jgi:aminoglycoside phosphotransferase